MSRTYDYTVIQNNGIEGDGHNRKSALPVKSQKVPNFAILPDTKRTSFSDSEQNIYSRHKQPNTVRDHRYCLKHSNLLPPKTLRFSNSHSDNEMRNSKRFPDNSNKPVFNDEYPTGKQMVLPTNSSAINQTQLVRVHPYESKYINSDSKKAFTNYNGDIRNKNERQGLSEYPLSSQRNGHLGLHQTMKFIDHESHFNSSKRCSKAGSSKSQSLHCNHLVNKFECNTPSTIRLEGINKKYKDQNQHPTDRFVDQDNKKIIKADKSAKVVVTKRKFFEAKTFKFLMKIPGLSHFSPNRSKGKQPEYTSETLTNSLSFVRTVKITEALNEGSCEKAEDKNDENSSSLVRVYHKTTTVIAPVAAPLMAKVESNFSGEVNNDSFKRIPKPPDPRSYKIPKNQNLLISANLQRPKDKPPSIPCDLNYVGISCRSEDQDNSVPEYMREQLITPARTIISNNAAQKLQPRLNQIPALPLLNNWQMERHRNRILETIEESDIFSDDTKKEWTPSYNAQGDLRLQYHWDFIDVEDVNYAESQIPSHSQLYSGTSENYGATKSSSSSPRRRAETMLDPGGFRQALITHPPPPPPSLLRRLGTKEISGLGKVKVVVRVSGEGREEDNLLQVDTKKRQVTLTEQQQETKPSPQDRRPTVAAPKMFAFDALFTPNEPQSELCSSALTDLIHAVINGVDSCLFSFGQHTARKTETMIGTSDSCGSMGAIPCAISWLYRCISEQKQKTGMKYSIRVSALEVAAPTWQTKDLLAHHAVECSEGSTYMNLGQVELRAPSVEQAAYLLDSALASRSHQHSHFFYTLHLYQYSVAGKGAVSGGRSRLHLIDLGSCGKTPGGIPLSGIGNILLAIFNGQKHFPHKEHKLTQQLRDCLGSLTCHAAMVAHVSRLASNYTDTLTTLQFASRVHRMRRRKFKFLGNSCIVAGEDSNRLTGSSDFDPSSSEQSADTVIYLGPSEETDGEHPPVYIPSLNSGDNRGSLGKVLKGSILDQKSKIVSRSVPGSPQKSLAEVTKKNSLSKGGASSARSSPVRVVKPQGSREERWVDGPRISRNRTRDSHGPETWVDGPKTHGDSAKPHYDSPRHYDNLKSHESHKTHHDPSKTHLDPSKNHFELPKNHHGGPYGFMDQHKKNMIRQWVENQCAHISTKPRHKPDNVHQPVTPPTAILPLNRVQSEVPLEKLQCSGPKSPDMVDEMEVEIIEVEEPAEPVPMQDSCLQVTEEDIALCMGELENPLPEVDQEEHPLRILSQENLTIVSTFTGNSTDSLTATHELERLFPPNHKIFNKSNPWQEEDTNDIISSKMGSQYESLSRLHELYESRLRRSVEAKVSRSHSLMLSNILQDSNDFDTNSIASEPAYLPGENKNSFKISKDLSSHALFKANPNNLYQNLKTVNGVDDGQEDEEEAVVPPPLTADHLLTLSRHSIGFDNGKNKSGDDGKNIRNGVHDPGGQMEYWRREEWSWSENYMKLSRDVSSTNNRSFITSAYGHTGHSLYEQRNSVHHATNPQPLNQL